MTDRRFHITERVEEINPTDRVRGTVINVTASGMFVVKFDNGDYLAYQSEEVEGFESIPHKPIPRHAADQIQRLHTALGRTPPEDAMLLTSEQALRAKVPRQGANSSNPAGTTLTPEDQPPSIEA